MGTNLIEDLTISGENILRKKQFADAARALAIIDLQEHHNEAQHTQRGNRRTERGSANWARSRAGCSSEQA